MPCLQLRRATQTRRVTHHRVPKHYTRREPCDEGEVLWTPGARGLGQVFRLCICISFLLTDVRAS